MDKNWLIRTKSNHILGPVSKEKVLELYKNNSIKGDDEVCAGNGYWFYIRETELVNKYILGENIQSFNPISEAKDVLTSTKRDFEEIPQSDDITLVKGIKIPIKENPAPLSSSPLNILPEVPTDEVMVRPAAIVKKKLKRESLPVDSVKREKKKLKKQPYLKFVALLGFIVFVLMIYYRKLIIDKIFGDETAYTFEIMPSAHAQEVMEKKNFLSALLAMASLVFLPKLA